MKILLSAYACEPNRGSEPGVGWNWALALAKRGHEVRVITRSNNQECIEAELKKSPPLGNLQFYYYDLPVTILRLKKIPGGIYWYYLLWQLGILGVAKKIHTRESMDLVHHITFGVFRQPSFLWRLGVPFIFGPVGGGERAPRLLCKSLTLKQQIKENIRLLANKFSRLDPAVSATLKNSNLILTKTSETLQALPARFHEKCSTHIEIGIESEVNPRTSGNNGKKFIFVGRFIYWKGGQYAIQGFSKAARQDPELHLTLIGKGPQKVDWQRLVRQEGIEHQVTFIDWMPQEALKAAYRENDIFIFPSLHDSSGNVLLEAMCNSLPIICLGLGGPGEIVDSTCGIIVPVSGSTDGNYIIDQLALAIERVSSEEHLATSLGNGAYEKSRSMSWDKTVENIYIGIESKIKHTN